MEPLERYLQAVRRYLPLKRQDDIIAELRANMESQIEDRESELGRPLTQGELEDLLRKMGPPVVVASRYQPQQHLIGPTLFPLYLYVLKIAVLWAFVIYSIVVSVVIPLTSPNATSIVDSLMRMPWILMNVAAWVTLVFAAVEFMSARYPNSCPQIAELTDKWHPHSLPPLEKEGTGKPRSYAQAVAEVIFGFLFLVWLLLIPKHPFLLMGPGYFYLRVGPFLLAPVWWTFYWWILSLNIVQNVWNSVDLARGAWRRPWRVKQIIFKSIGLVPLLVLFTARDHIYILLKNPAVDQAHYGQNLDQINNAIHLGLGVICAIISVQLAWDIWLVARDGYRSRGLAS
jgi:hypothetical protein